MLESNKKKALVFVFWFLMVFSVYFITLSDNMEHDGDYLRMQAETEGITPARNKEMAHLAWIPVGKLVYNLAHFTGYAGGSIKPLEITNILLAGLGSALFFILILELTESLLVSICLSAALSSAYGLWTEFVHTKLYSGGFLFIILSFYFYTRKDLKFKPLFIAAANSLAVLFHVTNAPIFICSLIYFLLGREKPKEKLLRILSFIIFFTLIVFSCSNSISEILPVTSIGILIYCVIYFTHIENIKEKILKISAVFLLLILIGLGCYYMLNIISSFYRGGPAGRDFGGQETSWLTFLRCHYQNIIGNIERNNVIIINTGCIAYSGLFIYLFIGSFKHIFKNSLFYLCLIFGSLFLMAIKTIDPLNSNFPLIFIPLIIISALILKNYKHSSLFKKAAVGTVLCLFALWLFAENFFIIYSAKTIGSDKMYRLVVTNTGNLISSSDLVLANNTIPYYLSYYLRCKVYYLHYDCNDENAYKGILIDINSHLDNGNKVKIFLDLPVKETGVLISQNIINTNLYLRNLSRDFNLEMLYQTTDKDAEFKKMALYEIKKKL